MHLYCKYAHVLYVCLCAKIDIIFKCIKCDVFWYLKYIINAILAT